MGDVNSARIRRPMKHVIPAVSGFDLAAHPVLEIPVDNFRRASSTVVPDEWIDQLCIVGTPKDWKQAIDLLVETGIHSVVLVPMPDAGLDEVNNFARHLMG